MKEIISLLQNVYIFSSLSADEIENVVNHLHTITVKEGEAIFNEGDEGNELYIVKSGIVSTSIRLPDGGEKEIVEFKAGDFFGEMSIFEDAPRSATCLTKTESSLFRLHQKDFFHLINSFPSTAIKIMYRMLNVTTQRLRSTGEFLSEMVRWGDDARKRAITDELTGCYNRRFLDDALKDYFESSKSSRTPLSLIMVDLDHFREINESYGHEVGDKVILEVVSVYKKNLREKDIIARYGGDEFTVIMPDTKLSECKTIAENICREVAQLTVLKDFKGPHNRVTTSQGVTSYPEHAKDMESLRETADQALYQAKENGRNRVGCVK
jgi:diguanylate cyclase (GGDEF)-like protein